VSSTPKLPAHQSAVHVGAVAEEQVDHRAVAAADDGHERSLAERAVGERVVQPCRERGVRREQRGGGRDVVRAHRVGERRGRVHATLARLHVRAQRRPVGEAVLPRDRVLRVGERGGAGAAAARGGGEAPHRLRLAALDVLQQRLRLLLQVLEVGPSGQVARHRASIHAPGVRSAGLKGGGCSECSTSAGGIVPLRGPGAPCSACPSLPPPQAGEQGPDVARGA
jgi:hypothetical protein